MDINRVFSDAALTKMYFLSNLKHASFIQLREATFQLKTCVEMIPEHILINCLIPSRQLPNQSQRTLFECYFTDFEQVIAVCVVNR